MDNKKIITLVLILFLYAFSFIFIQDLPTWISTNENFNRLFYLGINSVLAIAFIYYIIQK